MFLSAILAYVAAAVGVGFWRSRQVRTGDDFLVAGRSLPARVLVCTLVSTWIGSGSLFAGAGLGYRSGFSALWASAGAWAGIAVVYRLAPRIRRLAQYTVADILEIRFGPAARILGTLATVLAYTTIAAYQFRGGGRLLSLVGGLDPVAGALVIAACCVACTALAGMLSVAYLDIGNGIAMTAGLGVAVVYLTGHAGGFGPALAALRPDQRTLFGTLSPVDALALFLPTMALLIGEATLYQKCASARDERAARVAVAGWLPGTIALELLVVAVGIFGSAVAPGLTAAQSDAIVVRVALDALPTAFGMLLLAGAAAIVVSTANSFLLTSATSLVRDVYQRFIRPQADQRRLIAMTRGAVVLVGAVAFVVGNFFPTILSIALWAYTMYGAAVTPVLVAALAWPGVTRAAAVASMAAGMIATLAWELLGLRNGGHFLGVQTIYPALLLSVGTLIGGTLMAQERSKTV